MLRTFEAIYDNGKITFTHVKPEIKKAKVIIRRIS